MVNKSRPQSPGHTSSPSKQQSNQNAAPNVPQRSASSTSTNQTDAFKSAPTLGTITTSPTTDVPHMSPFVVQQASKETVIKASKPSEPSYGPAPRPFASSSSILTGSTPLTTTPGGSSTPIKLSMNSLTAAAANASLTQSPIAGGKSVEVQVTSPGRNQAPSVPPPPSAPVAALTGSEQAGARPVHSKQGAGVALEGPTGGAASGPERNPNSALANWMNTKTIVRARPSESVNWSYYLFLGIFLLVLLFLVITLILTNPKKS